LGQTAPKQEERSAISRKIGYATQPSENTRKGEFANITASTGWLCAVVHTHCPPQNQACNNAPMYITRQGNLQVLAGWHQRQRLGGIKGSGKATGLLQGNSKGLQALAACRLQLMSVTWANATPSSFDDNHSTSRRIWETTIVLLSMPQIAKQC
jgi:hypothetical protein